MGNLVTLDHRPGDAMADHRLGMVEAADLSRLEQQGLRRHVGRVARGAEGGEHGVEARRRRRIQ
ncbi:hypothetical protein D3877_23210, partial [Azospirillum cavernae]